MLGKYLESYKDFQMACKLDFDETTQEWLKEVEGNVSLSIYLRLHFDLRVFFSIQFNSVMILAGLVDYIYQIMRPLLIQPNNIVLYQLESCILYVTEMFQDFLLSFQLIHICCMCLIIFFCFLGKNDYGT